MGLQCCGVGVSCAYAFIGSAWLVMKTEGQLQQSNSDLSLRALVAFVGIAIVPVVICIFSRSVCQMAGASGVVWCKACNAQFAGG